MKRIILTTVLLVVMGVMYGQKNKLFIPKELQKAYDAGSRSFTGEPGENYFQNRSSYVIEAEFDPETGLISGTEEITYENNSPDILKYVAIRLT